MHVYLGQRPLSMRSQVHKWAAVKSKPITIVDVNNETAQLAGCHGNAPMSTYDGHEFSLKLVSLCYVHVLYWRHQ